MARDLQGSLRREPALCVEQLAERWPLDEFHYDESVVAVDPGVEHRDHVRVLQPGEDLRLLLVPRDRAGSTRSRSSLIATGRRRTTSSPRRTSDMRLRPRTSPGGSAR